MSNNNKRWTRKEEQFLIDNYCDFTDNELADITKRTYHSIRGRAKRLGLTKHKQLDIKSNLKDETEVIKIKPKPKEYRPTSISKINELYKLRV